MHTHTHTHMHTHTHTRGRSIKKVTIAAAEELWGGRGVKMLAEIVNIAMLAKVQQAETEMFLF